MGTPTEQHPHREPAPPSRWYAVSLGFVAVFIIMFCGFIYLKHLQDQATASKRAADQQQAQQAKVAEQQRAKALADTCAVIDSMQNYYSTLHNPIGDGVAATWARLRVTVGCPPNPKGGG
jgi:hypothetical protein